MNAYEIQKQLRLMEEIYKKIERLETAQEVKSVVLKEINDRKAFFKRFSP